MVDDNKIYTGERVCDNVNRNEATDDTGRSRTVLWQRFRLQWIFWSTEKLLNSKEGCVT